MTATFNWRDYHNDIFIGNARTERPSCTTEARRAYKKKYRELKEARDRWKQEKQTQKHKL